MRIRALTLDILVTGLRTNGWFLNTEPKLYNIIVSVNGIKEVFHTLKRISVFLNNKTQSPNHRQWENLFRRVITASGSLSSEVSFHSIVIAFSE